MRRFAFIAALVPTTAAAAEPDEMGPLAVDTDTYDFGDEVFSPVQLNGDVEVRAEVYSPTALDQGPYPIVFVMHGRHGTCYDPANPGGTPNDGSLAGSFIEWPCSPGRVSIPSHEGYAYLGELLASHGIITVSVSANGINGVDDESEDAGAAARADLLNEHLVRWGGWNEGNDAPFDGKFNGAVDLESIGVIGHSRGGEGAAAWAAFDQADGAPNFIDAALLLAPIDLNRYVIPNVALSVVLPYCDGDVFNLEGAHFFDDARYAEADDQAPKYTFTLHGTNHNYFNTIWTPLHFPSGAFDDWTGMEDFFGIDAACANGADARLNDQEQRAAFAAYTAAFFRVHLQGDLEWDPILRGEDVPASGQRARPLVGFLGPDRIDVNHLDTEASLMTNELGEAVTSMNAPGYELCGLADDFQFPQTWTHCVDTPGMFMFNVFDGRQPHVPGLGQLRIALEANGSWFNALPEGTDASGLVHLQFRAVVDFESALAPAPPMATTLTVELIDGAGATASASVELGAPAGNLPPVLPRKLLHTIRVPLDQFEGVELADLSGITLAAEGSAAVLLSDLAFADAVPDEPGTGSSDTGGSDDGPAETSTGTTTTEPPPPTTNNGGTAGAEEETGTAAPAAPSNEGCGCRSSGSGVPLSLLLLTGSLRRRRRRRSSPSTALS